MEMKKLFSTCILLFVTLTVMATTANLPIEIIIVRHPASSGSGIHIPRSKRADVVPIDCKYETSDGILTITFLDDMGDVSLTVYNMTTGESIMDFIDSSLGQAELKTWGRQGNYTIQIDTERGMSYTGRFYVE